MTPVCGLRRSFRFCSRVVEETDRDPAVVGRTEVVIGGLTSLRT